MNINLKDPTAIDQLTKAHGEEIIPFLSFLLTAWKKRQRITVAELPDIWKKYDDASLVSSKLIRQYTPVTNGEVTPCVKIGRSRSLLSLVQSATVSLPTTGVVVEEVTEALALKMLELLAVGDC
jgi:hypothetical protein